MSEAERDKLLEEPTQELSEELYDLLRAGEIEQIREVADAVHAADFADALEQLDDAVATAILNTLEIDDAADVFEELEPGAMASAVDQMHPERLADVLDEMPSDEAADVIGEMEPEQARELLGLMESEESAEVELLLSYETDTAGGIMAAEVVALGGNLTADQAIERLRAMHLETETHYYLYVIDHLGHLDGVVSLRQLLVAAGDALLDDLMHTPVICAQTDDDQEAVAQLFRKYGLAALPIVDADGYLRGIVTHDDILEVMEEELEEDLYRFAGTSNPGDTPRHLAVTAWLRLPVVLACLVGDVYAGHAVLRYESELVSLAALATFLPALMATGGNIGQQSLARLLREIASGSRITPTIWRAMLHEAAVGLMMGAVSGLALGALSYLWLGKLDLAILLAVALTLTSVVAAVLGAAVPLALERAGRDPAIASGPLITTLNDIISTTVYFVLAVGMIRYLGLKL